MQHSFGFRVRLAFLTAAAAFILVPLSVLAGSTVRTIAGTGAGGFNGDGIPASTAQVYSPAALTFDPAGNMYIADMQNNRIRKISATTGLISTIAGTGTAGYNGDGILATSAWLRQPTGVTLDAAGNMYIADQLNHRIRKVDASTGLISTIAGTGVGGYNGDGIPANMANLYEPGGVALDGAGNMYIFDEWNARIRKVDLTASVSGTITTIAGTGTITYNGDGIPANTANISGPSTGVIDAAGDLVFTERDGHRIRKITFGTGLISTIAGTGANAYNGDGIPATTANIGFPTGIVYDDAGNLYVTDYWNNRVRRIDAATGLISTVVGSGAAGDSPDGTPALLTAVTNPLLVALDAAGNLYWSAFIHRVRRLAVQDITVTKTATPPSPLPGQPVTYTIVVTNAGDETHTNLLVVDSLPGAIALTGQSNTAGLTWNSSPSIMAWSGPVTLNPAGTVTITINGTAATWYTGSVCNVGYAVASNITGSDAKSAFACFPLAASTPAAACGTPAVVWTRTYNGASSGDDNAYTMTVDNAGNMIAAGPVTVAGLSQWLIRKYDPAGNMQWERTYVGPMGGGDQPNGVGTDGNGNVVVGGTEKVTGQGLNWMIRKYSADGTLLWSRSHNNSANTDDYLWDLAVNPVGEILAVGSEDKTGIGQNLNWYVAKYDASGNMLWSRTHNGGNNSYDEAYGAGWDGVGAAYAVGYEVQAGGKVLWRIVKYDTNGNQQWFQNYSAAPANSDNRATRVAVTPSGNVIVGGQDLPTTWPNYNWQVRAYSSAGTFLWNDAVAGSGSNDDRVNDIAVAPDGTILAAGHTTESGQERNWLLRAYNDTGTILWSITYNGTAGNRDQAFGIAGIADGAIYAGGEQYVTGQNQNWLLWKIKAPACPPAISVQKTALPATVNPGDAVTYTIVVTNTGTSTVTDLLVVDTLPPAIALTGQSNTAGLAWNANASVMGWSGPVTLNPGGTVTITINGTAATWFTGSVCNTGYALASNTGGNDRKNSFVCFPLVASPPPSACGAPLVIWSRTYNGPTNTDDYVGRIATDPSGNVIAAGHDGSPFDWRIRKYDTNGNLLWSVGYAGPSGSIDEVYGVATDAAGNVVVAGSEYVTGQNYNWLVRKYDSGGNYLWSYGYNSGGSNDDRAYGIATDPAGNVLVTGFEPGLTRTTKLTPAGAVVWTKTFVSPGGSVPYDVATDGVGNVVVAGTIIQNAQLDTLVLKYDSAGTLLWSRSWNSAGTSNDEAWGVAIDASGNIFYSGEAGPDWMTGMYDASGNSVWRDVYNSPGNGQELAKGIVVDPWGYPVAFGFEARADLGQDWNWLIRKYTPAGTLVWSMTYNSPANAQDYARGGAYDTSGNLYIGGNETRSDLGQNMNWRIMKVREGVCGPSISVHKSVTPATAATGSPVTYTIMVTNTSATVISDLVVTDTLPAQFAYVAQTSAPALAWNASTTLPAWSGSGLAIGPGETATVTIDGIATSCIAATVYNTGYAVAANANGSDSKGNTTALLINAPVLAVSVVKTQTGGAGVGDPVSYQIVVTNTGSATIDELVVVDTISAVVQNVATTEPGGWAAPTKVSLTFPATGTRYVWSGVGLNMLPGDTLNFKVDGVMGLVCATRAVSNTAFVIARNVCGEAYGQSLAVGSIVAAPVSKLTIVKTQTPTSPTVGSAVQYKIVVTNAGSMTVDELIVVDTIQPQITGTVVTTPAGFSARPVVQMMSGTIYSWVNSAPFLPGTVATFQLDGIVGAVCLNAIVSNTAYLTAATACTATRMISNGTAFSLTAPVLAVSVVKTQTGGAGIGAPVQYKIVVTNTGSATVDSLTIVDTISPVVQNVVTAQPGFGAPVVTSTAGSGTRYAWSAAGLNLLPTQAITITMDGTMGLVCASKTVSNTAFVIAQNACAEVRVFSNAVGSVITPPALAMTVVKTRTPASPAIGSAVGYQIVVTNTGGATIDDLTVVDTISPVITAATDSHPGAYGAPVVTSVTGGTRYVWSAAAPGLLPPGGTLTFRVDGVAGRVCTATVVNNTASGAAGSACATARVQSADDSFTVAGSSPVLAAVMRVTPAEPSSGGPVRYTIIVTNTGAATAADLTVVDTLPEGVTFSGQSATGGLVWNNSTRVPAWTGTINLAPGGSVTIVVDGVTTATFVGTVTDTVWAFATGGCGASQVSTAASFTLAPADQLGNDNVRIVGGIRGYIQPKRGEQATILVRPKSAGQITVRIYNLAGELVREMTAAASGGKTEVLHWDAKDSAGRDVPPGAYPILIEAPGIRYKDTLAVLR